jgi:hypothetical protein
MVLWGMQDNLLLYCLKLVSLSRVVALAVIRHDALAGPAGRCGQPGGGEGEAVGIILETAVDRLPQSQESHEHLR